MALSSFTARITALFALLVTATTAVVLLVGGWLLSEQSVKGLDALNGAEFEEVRERLEPLRGSPTAEEIDRLVRPHTEIDAGLYFFQVHAERGGLLFRSANLGRAVLPDLTGGGSNRTEEVQGLGRVRLSEFRVGELHVQIASSLESTQRLLGVYMRTSLVLLGGVALASLGLGWSFARFVLRPVRAMRETASRISADNLGERISVPCGRDEIAALAALLNQMLARLEASFAEMKRFTADASHELKTPLALIRLNAEKLRPKLAADPEASEVLADLLEDLDLMRRIIDSLLFLAKADSGGLSLRRADLAADELVRTFAEDAAALADDRGVRFRVVRLDAGRVCVEPTLVRQLLLNLVSNACRAAPVGGEVTLESVFANGWWRLAVSDDGPGLPPEQLERVFARFVRFAPKGQRDPDDNGHGLGLAICRSIAGVHGGKIRAANRSDGPGLRVTVELPIHPDSSL